MLLLYAPKGRDLRFDLFQWAPTLGGECYRAITVSLSSDEDSCFNGHPPLGVNATHNQDEQKYYSNLYVSMGTHPWG